MDRKVKDSTIRRLKIVQGHLDKVLLMVEEDAYCPDVIHQSQAVQAALKKIDEIILSGHLFSCVLKDKNGKRNQNKQLVGEIVGLFKKK